MRVEFIETPLRRLELDGAVIGFTVSFSRPELAAGPYVADRIRAILDRNRLPYETRLRLLADLLVDAIAPSVWTKEDDSMFETWLSEDS